MHTAHNNINTLRLYTLSCLNIKPMTLRCADTSAQAQYKCDPAHCNNNNDKKPANNNAGNYDLQIVSNIIRKSITKANMVNNVQCIKQPTATR